MCRSILTISDEVHGVSWVFQESLGIDKDGIKALLLPKLFILALTIVSTDSAKLVPLGKYSTAIETLKKIPPRSSFTMLSLYIIAKVAGKPVFISKASIRSDLLFDDANGIDSLPNQAIFYAIQLMGYEGDLLQLDAKKKFVMYPRFISIFLDKQLMDVPVYLDHFPVNALISKVFSIMIKQGKHFSWKVTPLFASILVQPTEDEGATLERPSEPQPAPSSSHQSRSQFLVGIMEVTDQAKEIKHLKAQIKRLKKKAKPVITHHIAWMKSVSLKQRLARNKSLKKNWMQKESVSKQERKSAKAEPSVYKDPLFDELPDDTLDYMDTEDAQDVGRTRDIVNKEKESAEDAVSTEGVVSIDKEKVSTGRQNVSTDRPNVSTDRPKVNTDKEKDSTVSPDEGTDDQKLKKKCYSTTQHTSYNVWDDETMLKFFLNMSQAKSMLRENPLLKINPKDKGKKKIKEEDESDTESEGIPEAEKKFKQLG
ncbi:hypothetical protein Tco_0001347 [Tanacetum coccineum]